ncbi:NADH pyrophosphatase [Saitozyma podzolica]|uniref:NAD(+) diphosphatase n=1 Tax=Saitozyma podzolica TaxID=1890683 RepID=A0A427XTU6_9TREE|nr:NADH pyrophosphatase [Saitozyma podzolica]
MGDNIVNFYAGQPPLNRLSFQRQSADKLNEHLEAPNARFVLYKDLKPLVHKDEPGKLLFLSRKQVEARLGGPFQSPSPEDAQSKDRARLFEAAHLPHTLPALVFLGVDDRPDASSTSVPARADPMHPEGVPYFALDTGTEDWEIQGGAFGDARASGSAMSGWEAGVFALSRALIDWNVRNKFCAACGSPTYSLWGGWKRSCLTGIEPVEGKECFSLKGLHNFAYPRTDSVVIMGILSSDGDKMLLGRQKTWPKGMYSCLAGFIEPGESFEDAVRREVLEEAGIEVGPVRYSSSQPWPYPANIMVGCFGRAKDGQTIRLDLDNELEDAQWFPRSQLAALIADPSGSYLSRDDHKKLELKGLSEQELANALAPAEGKPDGVAQKGPLEGLTRVPPATAIAGQLIRVWAEGKLELVSKL